MPDLVIISFSICEISLSAAEETDERLLRDRDSMKELKAVAWSPLVLELRELCEELSKKSSWN